MNNRTRIALAAATALTLTGGVAVAQDNIGAGNGSMMSIPDTVGMLEDKGYTDIDSIDRDLGRYEVDATDSNGRRVQITVDAKTGKILDSERDDD